MQLQQANLSPVLVRLNSRVPVEEGFHPWLQLFTYSLPVDILDFFAVAANGHIYSRREVHVRVWIVCIR